MKLMTVLKAVAFPAIGFVLALIAIRTLGVENDVPGFKQAAQALDQ